MSKGQNTKFHEKGKSKNEPFSFDEQTFAKPKPSLPIETPGLHNRKSKKHKKANNLHVGATEGFVFDPNEAYGHENFMVRHFQLFSIHQY